MLIRPNHLAHDIFETSFHKDLPCCPPRDWCEVDSLHICSLTVPRNVLWLPWPSRCNWEQLCMLWRYSCPGYSWDLRVNRIVPLFPLRVPWLRYQALFGHTWVICCLNSTSGEDMCALGKLPLWCYLGFKCSILELRWPGIPWPHLGHLLLESYTRITQHELWPEWRTLTKANHFKTL